MVPEPSYIYIYIYIYILYIYIYIYTEKETERLFPENCSFIAQFSAKNGRNTKIATKKISRFLNLHNLLEGACNHIKLYTVRDYH